MDEVYIDLAEKGFASDQIHEIEEGLKNQLDVSVYAHKDYFALQMQQIRLGMMDGLPVSVYADPIYDWFQMEEIRKGLKRHLDISLYSSPDIPYDKMRQIRKGIIAGIDLTPYMQLEAGILRELRKAWVSRVNIIPYISEGYDREQLEQIRKALKKGIDIHPYLLKQFRGASIREIYVGLENGIDASAYAKACFDWRQMKEIRLGMEHRVDTTQYLNRLYDWKQMREIRLGLEEGLDISSYHSLMYTAGEMRKKRLCLEEDIKEFNFYNELTEDGKQIDRFVVTIKNNGMEAYIEINKDQGAGEEITRKDVVDCLFAKGITDGIVQDAVEDFVDMQSGDNYGAGQIMIAQGEAPQNGTDGWYEFFFDTDITRTPVVQEDGSVDYQNVKWFETVRQGQKIAYYHEAEAGIDGYTVTGRRLKAQRGREMNVLVGKGFRILPDKRTYVADETGKIEWNGKKLIITKMLTLDDMTLSTGNIDFDGCVLVRGNVGSGSVIRASDDIIVDGYVESAVMESGGSVILRGGVNASGRGLIKAKKSVIGKFFESVKIDCGVDICAGYCLNCNLYAEGQIIILGAKGMLEGGTAYAVLGIQVNNVGNSVGIKTMIYIGMNENIIKQQQNILNQITKIQKELDLLENAGVMLQKKYTPEICHTMETFRKIEKAIYTKEKQLEKSNRSKEKLDEKLIKIEGAKALIKGNVYEGVCMEINGEKWNAKTTSHVLLKNVDGRVAVYAN